MIFTWSSYHLILNMFVHRQVCMSEDDVHVRDGQDSHENADLIFYQAVNQGGGAVLMHISLSSLPDIRPGNIHLVVSLLAAPRLTSLNLA